jgi:hypothetical protein
MVLDRGKPFRQLHDRGGTHVPESAEKEVTPPGPGNVSGQLEKPAGAAFLPPRRSVQSATRRRIPPYRWQ